jgi:hypothetical protein
MNPAYKRFFAWIGALLLLILACLIFPEVLAFVELAARELRYFWWLVLIVALGVWLIFFTKQKKP